MLPVLLRIVLLDLDKEVNGEIVTAQGYTTGQFQSMALTV